MNGFRLIFSLLICSIILLFLRSALLRGSEGSARQGRPEGRTHHRRCSVSPGCSAYSYKEVWGNIITLCKRVSITEIVHICIILIIKYIYIVLNNVLCISKLFVNRVFPVNGSLLVIFAVTNKIDVLTIINQRLVLVNMVNHFAVLLFIQFSRQLLPVIADKLVYHIFKNDVEIAHQQPLLIRLAGSNHFRFFKEDVKQIPKGDQFVRKVISAYLLQIASALPALYHRLYFCRFQKRISGSKTKFEVIT